MTRFDAYEVSPVLATDIDGMGGTEIQAFGTLAEAVTTLAETEAAGLTAQLSWTVYGHTPGEGAEAIADFTTEADAFALLYKLTGIAGQTGVTLYRLPHPQTMTVWTCTSQAEFEPTTTVHAQEHDAQAELLGRMRSDLTPHNRSLEPPCCSRERSTTTLLPSRISWKTSPLAFSTTTQWNHTA